MSNKLSYSSVGKTVDGTMFCSGVETLAENLIEDNESDSIIVFPSATGWASMRSTSYTMTDQNTEMHLPLPIYKIRKVYLRPATEKVTLTVSSGNGFTEDLALNISEFKNANGRSLILDITDMVVAKQEWAALPLATSIDDYNINIVKDNTFYWEQGSNIIPILSTIYKIHQLNSSGVAVESPVYTRLLSRLKAKIEDTSYIYTHIADGWKEQYDLFDEFGVSAFLPLPDVREWQFRIEYVPISSKTKIRARKNAPTQQEYIQPFNQRAEINAASAFGKNMYLTAQKTGCRQITIVQNYTKLKDIPPLGALVRHNGKKYRLVANHYVQTNTVYMQVTHTLSENWSERSKHVAVDQKYRNWSIPQDTLWRNLYWEDYLRVGTSLKTSDDVTGGVSLADIMKGLYVDSKDDKTVDTFAWLTDEDLGQIDTMQVKGATVPCSTYGIANSLIFSATFKDNLSAGLRAAKWGKNEETGTEEYLCEEALYCKADGTLDKATVLLGKGCGLGTSFEINEDMTLTQGAAVAVYQEAQNVLYPSIIKKTDADTGDYILTNVVQTPVFDKEFYIYKDPGEALKFTYQIHLIGEDDCFFGNKFAEHNPLIKDWKGADRKFKVWALTHYAREGTDILETISGDTAYEQTADGACFTVAELEQTSAETKKYGEAYTLTLSDVMAAALQGAGCKAWAITDENKNLYVACNDASVKALYFQLHHKR